MNIAEMRSKTAEEIRKELQELQREHFNIRMQKATQQLNRTSELGRVRRQIARAMTIISEKEAAQ